MVSQELYEGPHVAVYAFFGAIDWINVAEIAFGVVLGLLIVGTAMGIVGAIAARMS